MFYSKDTGGFYSQEIHGDKIPVDAIEIAEEQYVNLLKAQSAGATIQANESGMPIAVAAPELNEMQLMQKAVSAVKLALQAAIDTKARAAGFSSGNALMLYAGFTNPFKSIAIVFAQWEANVWLQAETYKAQVLEGKKPMLTPDEAVAMMPVYPV
jgi:hypothetical protein